MKNINGELDNLSDFEKYVLSFFYEIRYSNGIYKNKEGLYYFNFEQPNILYVDYINVWQKIEIKYNPSELSIRETFNMILHDILDLPNYKVDCYLPKDFW